MFEFDACDDRLAWSAVKWEKYRGRDIIPLWVADMDFAVAPAIRDALAAQVAHGVFGYTALPRELPGALADDYAARYDWKIDPSTIVWLSGLVSGINLAVRACCPPDDGVITFSPVYPPFLQAPAAQACQLIDVGLAPTGDDGMTFRIDFAALEQAVHNAPRKPRLLLLCHPHNPVGRLFERSELDRLAAFCAQHELYVCSDEVHCDLILDGETPHVPFARVMAELSPELLKRTITLHGPGKTYNIAGLGIAWAIIPDPELRRRFQAAMQRLVPGPSCFAGPALLAALREGEPWRQALLTVLRSNRDRVSTALDAMGLPHTHPEVSFLTWIDARQLAERVGNPARFFEQHGIGLSDGTEFGRPGFVRLNFGCPPALLESALARMQAATKAA